MAAPKVVVVVTGLSGAGKSTALHALEDLGYFCIDNLPTAVLGATLEACAEGGVERIALGVDVRVRGFFDDAVAVFDGLVQARVSEVAIVFLDASDQALVRRFSSTRRPHPLSQSPAPGGAVAAPALIDGITLERERLASLRARASLVIDTTSLSVHDLRGRIVARFAPGNAPAHRMRTRIVSFGFKYGAPVDADLLFDVRFLANPYFEPELSAHSGAHAAVRDYVLAQEDARRFLQLTIELLRFTLPRYAAEGKSYLTIGIGCTGGRHRSVVVAEQLERALKSTDGVSLEVVHRDVERSQEGGRISDVGAPPRPSSPPRGGAA